MAQFSPRGVQLLARRVGLDDEVVPLVLEPVWKSTSESGYFASRYLGTAAMFSAQTWTRSPRDTLDRLERAAPRANRERPQIEAQVEL